MKSNSKFDINDIKSVQLNLLDSLNLINRKKYITQAELSKLLDLSENCIYKNLRTLKAKGIIERIGSNKKGYWKILNLEEKSDRVG